MQATAGAHPEPKFCGLEHFKVCIAVFDSRLGQREGQENDKVLAFFPSSSVPPTTRTIIVGLAQALNGFADTFKQGDEHDESYVVTEAQHQTWVLHECEPCIWILMVVSKAWLGSSYTHAALKGYVHNLYALLVLLHGPLQHTLDQTNAISLAHDRFQPVLDEAGRLLTSQGPRLRLASVPVAITREASALANPLGLHSGIPLLVTPEPSYLGAQCLSGRLMNLNLQPPSATSTDPSLPDLQPPFDRPVLGVHIAWHGMPVWSTLDTDDAYAVHALMQRALLPAAGIGRKKPNAITTALAAAAASTTYRLTSQSTTTTNTNSNPSTTTATTNTTTSTPFSSESKVTTLLNPQQWTATAPTNSTANQLGPSGPSISNPSASNNSQSASNNMLSSTNQTVNSQTSLAAAAAAATRAAAAAATGGWLTSQSSTAATPTTAGAAGAAGSTPASTTNTGVPPAGWLVPTSQLVAGPSSPPPPPPPAITPASTSSITPLASGWALPHVWLRSSSSHLGLLPYYHGALMVLLLMRPGVDATQELLTQAHEVLGQNTSLLSTQLQASLPPSSNLWHQQGYRYCHVDVASDTSRATPIKKVTTLSEPTLRLAAHTRNKTDHWRRTRGRPGRGDSEDPQEGTDGNDPAPDTPAPTASGAGQDGAVASSSRLPAPADTEADMGADTGVDGVWDGAGLAAAGDQEVVVRTAGDAWVVTRRAESRRLHVAIDQSPVSSLLGVSAHVQKLCDRLYPGYFVGFG